MNEMDDALVTIRMQYVEDLEDILQCPVCWELPTGLILTCMKGHHVCETCQKTNAISMCPSCQSRFNGSRNYLGESLSSKFDDIKSSILDPAHYINRKIVKKCIQTQTTNETTSIDTQTEINDISVSTQTNYSETSTETQTDFNGADVGTQTDCKKLQPNLIKETTLTENQCQITCLIETCKDRYSHDNIHTHFKCNHKDRLIEVISSENGLYSSDWNILYEKNKSFNYVINIHDMGLIFFNVFINEEGDLYGNIEVLNSYCNGQHLYYILLITNVQNSLLSEVFKGIVPSCLSNSTKNINSGDILISNSCFARYLLTENESFNCSLTLYRPENS